MRERQLLSLIRCNDGSNTFHSSDYDQTFHSSHGAVTETRHIFLEASGVAARLQTGVPTRILEIGFGLGLNFLLTADLAICHNASLDFRSWEKCLLDRKSLELLEYGKYLQHPTLLTETLTFLDSLAESIEIGEPTTSASFTPTCSPCVQLHLYQGDATAGTVDGQSGSALYDVVYLDAFSPGTNPECWEPPFLLALHTSLKPGGKLASYCAQGRFRRSLRECGFSVEALPGPPGKREITIATA